MIYLDHAATSFPKSGAVLLAVQNALMLCGNPGRSGHPPARAADEILFRCRSLLAKLFGSTPENVVFTLNATAALNTAIKGLYPPGCEVVTSTLEHNSVMRPLHALRKAQEITLKQFRVDLASDESTVENFRLCAGRHAGMAVVTHASNVCGRVLPVKAMREAVGREQFLFIVDCAQTAGHIPINIREMGADVICIPGHKGLGGPMGVGALICNPERKLHFRTLTEGGSGSGSARAEMPELLPERLEAGTPNVSGIAGLAASLERFRYPEREKQLCAFLAEELGKMRGIRVYGRERGGEYMPVLLFNREGMDCEAEAEELARKGFAVRAGLHCAPAAHRALGTIGTGGVRISLGAGNTEEEAEQFLRAV